MKKYIAVAIAALCLLCFSACSPYPKGDAEEGSAEEENVNGADVSSAENGDAEHVGNGGIYTAVGDDEYGVGFDF